VFWDLLNIYSKIKLFEIYLKYDALDFLLQIEIIKISQKVLKNIWFVEKLGILLADRKLVTIFYPMLLLEREFIWFCEKGQIKSEKALKRELYLVL